ncbi:MAG: hypothetical protein Q7T20_14430, partial [Saprospiraceae bacterium]|nr:hypothetical protein [Saprospiraceae bacterium]
MTDHSPVFNAHPQYIESLYKNWQADPASVESDWQAFFKGFDFALSSTNGSEPTATAAATAPSFVETTAGKTADLKKEF